MIQAALWLGFPATQSSQAQDFDGNIYAEPPSPADHQGINPNIETNY